MKTKKRSKVLLKLIMAPLLGVLSVPGWPSVSFAQAAVALTIDTKVLGIGHRNLPGLKLNGLPLPTIPTTRTFPLGAQVTLEAPSQSMSIPNEVCFFQFWHVSDASGGRYFNTNTITLSLVANTTAVAWYSCFSTFGPGLNVDAWSFELGSAIPGGVTMRVIPPNTSQTTFFSLPLPPGMSVTLIAPARWPVNNPTFVLSNWTVQGANVVSQSPDRTQIQLRLSGSFATAIAWYEMLGQRVTLSASANCDNARIQVSPPGTIITGPQWGSFTYPSGTLVTLEALDAQLNSCGPLPVVSFFDYWEINGVAQPTGLRKLTLTLTQNTTAVAFYASTPVGACDPGSPQPGQYLIPGGSFHASGGADPQHDYKGVDSFTPSSGSVAPWRTPGAGAAYSAAMWHTGDWAVYHFRVTPLGLEQIDLCLSNPLTPAVGTPVEIYVRAPGSPASPPSHDSDLAAAPGWILVGVVTIMPPGNPQVYSLNVSIPPATEYSVAVRLSDGELGPDPGKDRNVTIDWIKLRNF